MTSEIAILNTSCVALAADSAVTIKSNLNEKVYNSANKIFSLSPAHAIGIMVYGNAEFMGIPWDVLINEFKSFSKEIKYESLIECKKEFLSFIETFKGDFMYEEDVIINITGEILEDFIDTFFEEIGKEEALTRKLNTQLFKYLKQEIDSIINNTHFNKEKLEYYKVHFLERCMKQLKENIEKSFPHKIYKKNLEQMCNLIFLKVLTGSDLNEKTGVVITGYGENDIFPTLIEIEIFNYCFESLHYKNGKNIRIHPSATSACIVPFAQKEMIYNFMQGVDPNLHLMYLDIFSSVLESYLKYLVDEGKVTLNNGIKFDVELDAIIGIVNDVAIDKQQEDFVNPILNTIKFLPKDALAEMAETLINLTSFKRKVTLELESVGGPIDVAIISKNEGFIWIKRKHYFNEKVNPKYSMYK